MWVLRFDTSETTEQHSGRSNKAAKPTEKREGESRIRSKRSSGRGELFSRTVLGKKAKKESAKGKKDEKNTVVEMSASTAHYPIPQN